MIRTATISRSNGSQFDEIRGPALAHRVPCFREPFGPAAPGRAITISTFSTTTRLSAERPGLDNAYLAAGFSGHGIQQSPGRRTRPGGADRARRLRDCWTLAISPSSASPPVARSWSATSFDELPERSAMLI